MTGEALVFSGRAIVIGSARMLRSSLLLPDAQQKTVFTCPVPMRWNCPQTEKAYLWFFEKLTGFMGTEMRLDATLSAIRQGLEKNRVLHEMLHANLGIKDIRVTGTKDEPIISALHDRFRRWRLPRRFWAHSGAGISRHTAFLFPHRDVVGRFGIRRSAGCG